MYARKRLDIGWRDITFGLVRSVGGSGASASRRRVEEWFAPPGSRGGALCTLSVRTGFDLYLRELALPAGSEILVSALTIPDMWKIVEHHGLVPVPVDIDGKSLAPSLELCRRAATPRTRALLIAHLFGTRIALEPYAALCREKGWLLLEDCAQAFTGPDYRGDPLADVSMFSFGPIKTAAALAGGVLRVQDARIVEAMRATESTYPSQERGAFAQRLCKYAGLKALSYPLPYTVFVKSCAWLGRDHDRVIQSSVRGFAGGSFFEKIRRRPSPALCALLERRLYRGDPRRVLRRTERSQQLVRALGGAFDIPGSECALHSFWVFTLLVPDPDRAVADLRAAGFDATRIATLSALPAPRGREETEPRDAQRLLARMVYLPVYPELPERRVEEMARILRRSTQTARPLDPSIVGARV